MWALIDWGTSGFRLWSVSDGLLSLEHSSENGVGRIQLKERQLAFLRERVEELVEAPEYIFAYGMVGSSLGPFPSGFIETPASWPKILAKSKLFELKIPGGKSVPIFVSPGVKSSDSPPNVMRGEELQTLALGISDAVILCPGTHSKHVTLSSKEIVGFRTFMTGELFQTIRNMPSLMPFFSIATKTHEPEWFNVGLELVGTAFSEALFAIRRWGLNLEGFEGADEVLSGLLIGLELEQLASDTSGRKLLLLADGSMAERYRAALQWNGISFDEVSGSIATEQIAIRVNEWRKPHE